MNEKLTRHLCEDYPNLYARRVAKEPFTLFGFECGDGWEPLIRRLSEKLEPLFVEAVQVKEKFGGLRFYINGGPKEAYDLIDAATEESRKTCERCGEDGTLQVSEGGWYSTLCERHK